MSELGRVSGEALYTARSTWFVCFPGNRDRLISFRGPRGDDHDGELELAQRTLNLFRQLSTFGAPSRDDLMGVGVTARGMLRGMPPPLR